MRAPRRLRPGGPTPEQEGRTRARTDALWLALIYGLGASLWISFSDRFLAETGLPRNAALFFSSIKGLGFVVVTATLLYVVALRHLYRLYASEERHARLFEHATEGLTLLRVVRDGAGAVSDLVIDDVNPTQSVRLQIPRVQMVGQRMSDGTTNPRIGAYFDLVMESLEKGSAARGEVEIRDEGIDELISSYPIEADVWAVASMDISEMRRAEDALRAKDEWIRDAYVDVLDAVTGGKLLLLSEEELEAELGERISAAVEVTKPEEIGDARRAMRAAVGSAIPRPGVLAGAREPAG